MIVKSPKRGELRPEAKFQSLFDAARTKLNGIQLAHKSTKQILETVRDYVAREDRIRAARFEKTNWLEDREASRDAYNETLALTKLYRHSSHEATVQGINTAAREAFGENVATSVILNSWETLRRAILELERRELARFKSDFGQSSFDQLFSNEVNQPTNSLQGGSIKLPELVDQYHAEYAKTKKSVGDKRRSKVRGIAPPTA